jgi:acyl carrier protein
MNDVAAKVCEIIKEKLQPARQIEGFGVEDTFEKLGLDDLDKFEIVIRVEEMFSIEISDEVADTWLCSKDIVTFIEKQ